MSEDRFSMFQSYNSSSSGFPGTSRLGTSCEEGKEVMLNELLIRRVWL